MNDDEIIAALQAVSVNALSKRATLVYRCRPRDCLMLCVLTVDGRRFAHQPRYKLSDDVNRRETVTAARAKHTLDGDRRWNPETFPLSLAAGQLSLECDHCRARLHVDTIAADVRAATHQPTEIRLSHDDVR